MSYEFVIPKADKLKETYGDDLLDANYTVEVKDKVLRHNCNVKFKKKNSEPINFEEHFKIMDFTVSLDPDVNKKKKYLNFYFYGCNNEINFGDDYFFNLDDIGIQHDYYLLSIHIKNAIITNLKSIIKYNNKTSNYGVILYLENVEFKDDITPFEDKEIKNNLIDIIILNNVKINRTSINDSGGLLGNKFITSELSNLDEIESYNFNNIETLYNTIKIKKKTKLKSKDASELANKRFCILNNCLVEANIINNGGGIIGNKAKNIIIRNSTCIVNKIDSGGGIIGNCAMNVRIKNCKVLSKDENSIIINRSGGIIGRNAIFTKISNCFTNLKKISINSGGIAGSYFGNKDNHYEELGISKHSYLGTIKDGNSFLKPYSTIRNSSSNGNITNYSGGICGTYANECKIYNCFSKGNIEKWSGGIISQNWDDVKSLAQVKHINISNCYSYGNISNNSSGIANNMINCNIYYCFSKGNINENSSGIISFFNKSHEYINTGIRKGTSFSSEIFGCYSVGNLGTSSSGIISNFKQSSELEPSKYSCNVSYCYTNTKFTGDLSGGISYNCYGHKISNCYVNCKNDYTCFTEKKNHFIDYKLNDTNYRKTEINYCYIVIEKILDAYHGIEIGNFAKLDAFHGIEIGNFAKQGIKNYIIDKFGNDDAERILISVEKDNYWLKHKDKPWTLKYNSNNFRNIINCYNLDIFMDKTFK